VELGKLVSLGQVMDKENQGLCLGLVGGLGVGATVHYYQELAKAHAARGAILNLVMIHADASRVVRLASAGETGQLAEYLCELMRRMASAGAQVAVMPAVTPHICAPELAGISPIPLVSLVEEIVREVSRRAVRRVALFGTRITIESGMFGLLQEVEVVRPAPHEIDLIHETYVKIVSAGSGTEEMYLDLRRIAHGLCEKHGVEAIILAGTELALIFNPENIDFPCIDGAQLHLDAIMGRLFQAAS
jgi:aspartate racemase